MCDRGSSPRMRGTLLDRILPGAGVRIIPAHAGNSLLMFQVTATNTDHPRACGELLFIPSRSHRVDGSSPRMRGTRFIEGITREFERIIPAHAGNSGLLSRRRSGCTDHPRACGELVSTGYQQVVDNGSSPRMRGTPGRECGCILRSRIIPAHAGNSFLGRNLHSLFPDHPRACGELDA